MTTLVTGATGLVGSRLLRRMVEAGRDCRAIVRPGKAVPAGVVAVEADLLEPGTLASAVEGVAAVVHLAAVFRTQNDGDTWRANLDGTRNLIAAVRRHAPAARFVMASTGLVYGGDAGRPGREGDAVDPKQAYPASKVAAEKELRESGLTWAVLRLPFVYGDGDGHLQMLPKLVDTMRWHPASRLSLIHHRDVATAVDLALGGAMDGRIVNVTDDAPASMYELMGLAGAEMAPSAEPLAKPWHGLIDGSLARSLGFRPAVATVYQSGREGTL